MKSKTAKTKKTRNAAQLARDSADNQLKNGQICPRDTDGDGDCGQPGCPVCGDCGQQEPGEKTKTVSQKLIRKANEINDEISNPKLPKAESLNARILLLQLVAQIETLSLIEDRGGF